MNKTTKLIVMSLLTVAMCVSLVAGATFALFTSQSNIDITVTSGKVSVKADVADVQYASDTTDNYVWQPAVEEAGVFSGSFAVGGSVTYTVATNELALINIAPGDAVKFTVNITNASTVKVKYILRVSASSDAGLYDLLNITADGEKLSGSPAVITEWTQLAATDGTDNAVDSVEMVIALPSAVDNDGADKSCTLTLTVLAVQANGATCADTHMHNFVDDVCTWCGTANPFVGEYFDDDDGEICGAPEGITDLYIPGVINGRSVNLSVNAFRNRTDIESVTLGEGITELYGNSWGGPFSGCTNLREVTLPSSITEIGAQAFAGCRNLYTINWPEDGSFEIGTEAFMNCSDLESLKLPEGCTRLGSEAFRGCTDLDYIEIPGTVKYWGSDVFDGCSKLQYVYLGEGLETIGEDAFSGTSRIERIKLPSTLKRIEEGAFSGNNLTYLELPKGLTYVGREAFNGNNIQTLVMYKGIETIGTNAFAGNNIQRLELPDGIKTIGEGAFAGNAFSEVNIPYTVKTLGSYCFEDCDNLTRVVIGTLGMDLAFAGNGGSVGSDIFYGTALQEIIYNSYAYTFKELFAGQDWPSPVNVSCHWLSHGYYGDETIKQLVVRDGVIEDA